MDNVNTELTIAKVLTDKTSDFLQIPNLQVCKSSSLQNAWAISDCGIACTGVCNTYKSKMVARLASLIKPCFFKGKVPKGRAVARALIQGGGCIFIYS